MLVVIKSKKPHFWQSCRVIEEQSLLALKNSGMSHKVFEIEEEMSTEEIEWLHNHAGVELIFFFLSDFLKQQNICRQILEVKLPQKRFLFPVYGNMTMEIYRWLELGKKLQGEKVVLLGASSRSCEQIRRLTCGAKIELLPYCFETEATPAERSLSTIDLVYAGRLTPQKNILELVSSFKEAFSHNPKLRLHLAGLYDPRLFHLHGYALDFEQFQKQFQDEIQSPGIVFHGNLKQYELLELFGKSDYFISMSTYHDEDFGMSACQAAIQGTGLILSDWGGHADFLQNSIFIPVKVNSQNIPRIETTSLIKKLIALTAVKSSSREYYRQYFSHQKFAERLGIILKNETLPFQGMSPLFEDFAKKSLKGAPLENIEGDLNKFNFYLSLYSSYLGEFKKI